MNKVWMTGDNHWNHVNVIKYCNRPFDTVEEMDEALINNWNSVVGKHDTVYHLGDMAFVKKQSDLENIISRLNGHIHWIFGNHDKSHVKKAKGITWRGDYKEIKYSFHDDNGEFKKYKIILSHFPMVTWDRCHSGSIHAHGHCHGSLQTMDEYVFNMTGERFKFPKPLRFDVGVDCWNYKPVNILEIIKLAEEYKQYNKENFGHELSPIDHHDGKRD